MDDTAPPQALRLTRIEPSELPHQLVDEEVFIPMPDGTRLAARIWRPLNSNSKPVPAILEYIPYRKRDGTRTRDEEIHAYLAAHGYACARVDMRGSGDSEGIQMDEYLPIEQEDGVNLVQWLAAQKWCTGSVGMFGLSWGGITALQIAALQPPALKAIVPVGASVDRYYDDGCYFLGCLAGETLGWGGVMFALNGRPPDPKIYGSGWREAWMRRLSEPPLFLATWLSHQQRDDYWLQGTICSDYERIKVPVYAISGWTDCWPNTVLRLLANLNSPRKGLSGPWGHMYPDRAVPGPPVNFADEILRWFDRWLKGEDNGIDREPMLTLYRQQEVSVDPCQVLRPGTWLDADTWPATTLRQEVFWLTRNGLADAAGDGIAAVSSPMSLGLLSGDYMPMESEPGAAQMPGDQRTEDAGSCCFDTPPLDEPLDIIGTPTAEFEVESDAGSGLLVVRLCDVDEFGSSTLITYGIMNLAQRDGREGRAPVVPGERYPVSLRLNDVAHRIVKGHRLRVAVSNAMWPLAWPVPDRYVLSLHLANCRINLPMVALAASDLRRALFQRPRVAVPGLVEVLESSTKERVISHDLTSGRRRLTVRSDFGTSRLNSADLLVTGFSEDVFEIADDDPLSATADYSFHMGYARDGWAVGTEGRLRVTCDREFLYVKGTLKAMEDDAEIYERNWNEVIPREGF